MTIQRDAVLSRLAIFVSCSVFIYLIWFFTFGDFAQILGHLADDASYYFRIAERVAAGEGSTFDGITRTNGYQPLWLLALVPVARLFDAMPETMVRIYLVYQTVILFIAGWLMWRVHSRFFPAYVLVFNSIFAAYFVFYSFANGMDSAILILMLAVLYYSGYRLQVFVRRSPGRTFLFGILLGLTMLARLDTVFLGISICGFCLFRALMAPEVRRMWLERLLLVVLGSSIVCAPYLVYNVYSFGAPMPISAALKSSLPDISFNVGMLGRRPLAFAIIAFAYVVWALTRLPRPQARRGYYRSCMVVLSFAVVVHALHTVMFMKWAVFEWHFAPYSLLVTLVISEPIAYAVERIGVTRRRWVVAFAIMMSLGIGYRIVAKTLMPPHEETWRVRVHQAAIWAREQTRPSDVFAMKDSGNFAYFSQRAVISLDGVVNNLGYQAVLNERRLGEYLRDYRVKYLVQHVVMDDDPTFRNHVSWEGEGDGRDYSAISFRYKSQLFGSYSEELMVSRSCEVYRGRPYREKRRLFPLLIWDLSQCAAFSRPAILDVN